MTVVRLTPYFYYPDLAIDRRVMQYEPMGGMQIQIHQTTAMLEDRVDRQVVVTTGAPGVPARRRLSARSELVTVRLPVPPLRTRGKGWVGLLVSWGVGAVGWAVREARHWRHRTDAVLHVHCSELPWTFVFGPLVGRLLRLPTVLTVHCSALETVHPATLFERAYFGFARAAERWALRRADFVITLSERVRSGYIRRGLRRAEDTAVVPDAVDTARFSPAELNGQPARARARFGIPPDAPLVTFCGRIAPEKGWRDFVVSARRVATQHPRARFLMCGDGNERDRLEALVREEGLAGRLAMAGFVPHDEIPAILAASDVVVVPSIHEELGGTILEAMALGRALVATRVGGIPDVVDDGVTGVLVDPGDAPAIATAVSELLTDPTRRERLGAAAVTTIADGYSLEHIATRTAAVYQHVLRQPAGSPA